MTTTNQPTHTTSRTTHTLTGATTLIRFGLRRDRVRIPIWVGALTLISILINGSWEELYGSQTELQELATTLDSPAMVAMTGVNHAELGAVTYGAVMAQQMLWFTLIGVAIMSVLLLARHTRTEEETGRAELVRSNVVGRHAYLTAALVIVGIANVAVGVLTAVGLAVQDVSSIDWSGSWLYGAAHIAVGLVFAGIAAITVQITEHSRGGAGLALAVLGAAYALRAMGDVGDNGLNWLSPIGWAQETKVYVDNLWWPLLIPLAGTAVFAGIGYYLSTRRDNGAGLRATRRGAATGSDTLTTPIGFALRLHRGLLTGFSVAMLLLGVAYGSVLGDAETMIDELGDTYAELVADIPGTITEAFGSMILTVMAIIGSIYVVMAMQRARAEEASGRLEPVLATSLSRSRWLLSHTTVAIGGGVVMLLLMGVGFAATGAATAEDASLFGPFLGGALTYAPAHWFTIGVAVALIGWVPRAMPLTWLIVVYAVIVVYMGDLLQLPDWLTSLSPFGHVPQVPADDVNLVPLVILTLLASGLIALGVAGLRRRDLQMT